MAHMTDDMTLATIATDADWLDLRDGDRGRLRGRLHSALRPGATTVLVSTCAWELIAVALDAGWPGEQIAAGRSTTIDVTRNEDGIGAAPGDVTIDEEEHP